MPPKQQVVAKKGQTDIFSFFNKPKVTEAAPSSSSISANKTLNQVNIESGDDKEHSSSTAISKSGDPPSGTSSQGSTLSSVAPQDKSQNLVEVTSSNQTVSDKAGDNPMTFEIRIIYFLRRSMISGSFITDLFYNTSFVFSCKKSPKV